VTAAAAAAAAAAATAAIADAVIARAVRFNTSVRHPPFHPAMTHPLLPSCVHRFVSLLSFRHGHPPRFLSQRFSVYRLTTMKRAARRGLQRVKGWREGRGRENAGWRSGGE